jgi:hypothetical protein
MKNALPLTVAAVKGIRAPLLPGRVVRPRRARAATAARTGRETHERLHRDPRELVGRRTGPQDRRRHRRHPPAVCRRGLPERRRHPPDHRPRRRLIEGLRPLFLFREPFVKVNGPLVEKLTILSRGKSVDLTRPTRLEANRHRETDNAVTDHQQHRFHLFRRPSCGQRLISARSSPQRSASTQRPA